MPIFHMPAITPPQIVREIRYHQTQSNSERLKTQIIQGVLASRKGFVLIKIGTYEVEPIKFNYDISMEDVCRADVEVGKIGIATKLLMSKYIPLSKTGELYLYATNDPKAGLLDEEVTSVKMY